MLVAGPRLGADHDLFACARSHQEIRLCSLAPHLAFRIGEIVDNHAGTHSHVGPPDDARIDDGGHFGKLSSVTAARLTRSRPYAVSAPKRRVYNLNAPVGAVRFGLGGGCCMRISQNLHFK
jgi:hypothetical protein